MTLADGTVHQADLIIAANGVHSTARNHVLVTDESHASDTGWATMRWLVPTEELLADPDTAALVEDSTQRYFMGGRGGGLVWYPCRKCVPGPLPPTATPCPPECKFADLTGLQQRGPELPLPLAVICKREYHRRYERRSRLSGTPCLC